jgi:tetratricopeptide (TPR) repeat protein
MQWQKRYAETIAILRPMIDERPNELEYRSLLMRAYFHTGDSARLARTLHDAVDHFKGIEQWTEHVVAQLASVCLETRLFDDCIRFYNEAITLHTRSRIDRGVGDGVLAEYYRQLAGALSGQGRTAEAVDAAAGAIVAWGRRDDQRARALQELENVLRQATDLDAYVAQLDEDVEQSGLENPVVRKALGNAYLKLYRPADAVVQLRRAIETRPEDVETHRALVHAYDRAREPALAAEALLNAARTAAHDPELYGDLGRRWQKAEDRGAAERAFTNIVEMQPNESESHALLAGIREEQRRWDDAAYHWRQVIRIRTQEPTGYVHLVRVLIESGQIDNARAVLDDLRGREWPPRFDAVEKEIRQLEKRLAPRESGS